MLYSSVPCLNLFETQLHRGTWLAQSVYVWGCGFEPHTGRTAYFKEKKKTERYRTLRRKRKPGKMVGLFLKWSRLCPWDLWAKRYGAERPATDQRDRTDLLLEPEYPSFFSSLPPHPATDSWLTCVFHHIM